MTRLRSIPLAALGPLALGLATLVCLAAMAVAAEPAGTAARPAAAASHVSRVIYPDQRIPLRFSHVQHLALPDALACESCHTRARDSLSSLDNLIPGEAACRPCHAIDRPGVYDRAGMDQAPADKAAPPARCNACHTAVDDKTGVVERVYIPPPNIKFNHAAHVRGQNMACTACHGDLAAQGVSLATRAQLPAMRVCTSCHDGKNAAGECVLCHLAAPGGRVQTEFSSGMLMPSGLVYGAAHDLTFRMNHRAEAQNNSEYCATCHRKSFCLDCHNGVAKPLDFHGNDYVSMHAVDARRNTPDCSACHRSQTFCTGCHSRAGVSADKRGSEFDPAVPERRFHPAGWSDMAARGPDHHAFQAQRNIQQCAACHREQFCVGCHTAEPGSMQVNPHPAGWATSRRCRALVARNARVCLRCHVDQASCE